MAMEIVTSDFASLTPAQLYDVLKLRQDVFMWEENIHYPDLDDVDKEALHVFAVEGEAVAAYARAYWEDNEKQAKIGRVVTAPAYRGKGLASKVVMKAVAVAREHYNVSEVWLDAQEHVISFYESLGFTIASEPFIEAGITHVKMVAFT